MIPAGYVIQFIGLIIASSKFRKMGSLGNDVIAVFNPETLKHRYNRRLDDPAKSSRKTGQYYQDKYRRTKA